MLDTELFNCYAFLLGNEMFDDKAVRLGAAQHVE
jgi:hypothetical protein